METFQPGKIDMNEFVQSWASNKIHHLGRYELTTGDFAVTVKDGNTLKRHLKPGDDVDVFKAIITNQRGIPTEGVILASMDGFRKAIPSFDFPKAITPTETVVDLDHPGLSDEEYVALPNEGWRIDTTPGQLKPVSFSIDRALDEWSQGPSIDNVIFVDFGRHSEKQQTSAAAD